MKSGEQFFGGVGLGMTIAGMSVFSGGGHLALFSGAFSALIGALLVGGIVLNNKLCKRAK